MIDKFKVEVRKVGALTQQECDNPPVNLLLDVADLKVQVTPSGGGKFDATLTIYAG